MVVHHSEDSEATCEDETEAGSVIGLLAMQSGGTVVCLFGRHQHKIQRLATQSRARQH